MPNSCRSYSFATENSTCYLSHHSTSTVSRRLAYKQAPLNIQTYELVACYDLKLSCLSDRFIADITTTRLFDGKVYLKHFEDECVTDVNNSLAFRFEVPFEGEQCIAKPLDKGFYLIDFVIQYFDNVVTFNDVWLSTTCQYDIRDQTLINDYDLGVYGIKPSDYDDIIAIQPSIELSVVHPNGSYIEQTADIGDLLTLKFSPAKSTSYNFFVKKLMVTNAKDNSTQLLLIDNGCPVKPFLVSPPYMNGTNVFIDFHAFKYTKSKFVRFVAVIGTCEENCEPINCISDTDDTELMEANDKKQSLPIVHGMH